MRIILVRHGHPDYARDCLTPLGHRHAAAAAERLKDEGIDRIYSSTCGRAMETAAHLAETLRLPVIPCDCFREIRWGSADGEFIPDDGHPWTTADRMVSCGEPLVDPDWQRSGRFRRNLVVEQAQKIASAADAWLQELGYTREGLYYRAAVDTDRTVALFGHGGETAALLCHLFNLPFPFTCAAMGPDYTGVTVIALPDAPGQLVSPRFELMNDARHIHALRTDNVYDR